MTLAGGFLRLPAVILTTDRSDSGELIMSEGSLEAPVRHPIPWQDPDFLDAEKLDEELVA